MSIKKRGLHRGLDALLTNNRNSINSVNNHIDTRIDTKLDKKNQINNTQNQKNPETIKILNIKQLIAGKFQPRKHFSDEELSELVDSIKNQGILQPLIVRKINNNQLQNFGKNLLDGNDHYEIIAGERRFRAAIIAGLSEIPIIIKNVSDKEALTIALIENIQRQNLNPLEEALALDRLTKEFSLTHKEIAMAIGKSRTVVTNLLRILQLPHVIKQMLDKGELELGHAKVLLGAPYEKQLKIANSIIENNLSVRATEELLKKLHNKNNDDLIDVGNEINNIINGSIDGNVEGFDLIINDQKSNNLNSNVNLTRKTNQLNNNKYSKFNESDPKNKSNYKYIDPDLSVLQRKLSEILGAKIIIENLKTAKNQNKGRLIIEYNSLEELDGILEHFELVT